MRWTLVVAAFVLALGLAPASAQKRVALVIGNDSYQNVTPLKKAGNDAERMAKTAEGPRLSGDLGHQSEPSLP